MRTATALVLTAVLAAAAAPADNSLRQQLGSFAPLEKFRLWFPLLQTKSFNGFDVGPPTLDASGPIVPLCSNIYFTICGDSCAQIAARFNYTVDSLLLLNYPVLDCNNVAPRMQICISCSPNLPICHSVIFPPPPPPPAPPSTCRKVYIVQQGDSCATIANSLDISVDQIHALNPWLSCYTQYIFPSQILCVA